MRIVFADTGYWIAILSSQDELHKIAKSLEQTIQPAHIVTSQMVLTEVLDGFSNRGKYLRILTVKFVRRLKQSLNVTIVPQTSELFTTAIELYEKRSDKQWSLTDCTSFCIMKDYCISEALAYDKHFEQAGYKALMRRND